MQNVFKTVLISCCLLLSCHPQKKQTIEWESIRYETTDASEIYFQNIRKSHYIEESNKLAGFNIYSNEIIENSGSIIKPKLVVSWRDDQARIIIESPYDEIVFFMGSEQEFYFDKSHHQNHSRLMVEIFNAIQEQRIIKCSLTHDKTQKRLFENETVQQQFRMMVFDFLRLVELR